MLIDQTDDIDYSLHLGSLNTATGMYTAILTNLQPGTQYDLALWTPAVDQYGEYLGTYLFGDAVATTSGAIAPNAPDNLVANWNKSGNTTTVHASTLSWRNESDNETGFQLERSTDPNFPTGAQTVIFNLGVDQTAYHDNTPDYDHNYYYRVRAVNSTTTGTAYSGWSNVVQLSPGPIIVMFYGADTVFTFPNEGNQTMQQIEKDLTSAGYQVGEFAADRVRSAYVWLLQTLDTNHDAYYDPNITQNPDVARPIEIFGHSWGGISVSFLCNAIRTSKFFLNHEVYKAIAIDPVNTLRFGDGRIRSNVDYYYDFYQTNPAGGVGVPVVKENIQGMKIDSDARVKTAYDDVFTDNLASDGQFYAAQDKTVNHFSIIDDVLIAVEAILEDRRT